MFFAEPAVLIHFKSVRVILLVFHCVVVALFALCASECDLNSHDGTSRFTEIFLVFRFVARKALASLGRRQNTETHHILKCWEKHILHLVFFALNRILCKKKEPTEVE